MPLSGRTSGSVSGGFPDRGRPIAYSFVPFGELIAVKAMLACLPQHGPPEAAIENAMIEFYPQIKWVHVAAVIASGSLFLVRGLAAQARAGWAMAALVRYLSYSIDTVLLAAGLTLLVILPRAGFANGWLTAKLVLLVFYIGLGTFALKRARTASVRLATFIGALTVYGTIVAIARTHDPRGPLLWLVN